MLKLNIIYNKLNSMEKTDNTKNTNLISIILPVYNGEVFISSAVQSVLSQTYQNWELLVIDDGSTDQTALVVANFAEKDTRIRLIKNGQNVGIQKTLNRGLREANGAYIARIDADDVWCDETKLEKQINYLSVNPNCVLVGTGVIVTDEVGKELFRYVMPETDKKNRDSILSKNCFVHSSVVFKKESALSVSGYDETIETRHIEDYDLWLKLGMVGAFANLPIYGVRAIAREGSISSKNRLDQFKKNLKLVRLHKNKYPHYLAAVCKSQVRIFLYRFISLVPKFLVSAFTKVYKENW